MEESRLNNVITNFFSTRVDIFPPKSTYKGFQVASDSEGSIDQHKKNGYCSHPQYGRIVYQDERGIIRKSDPIMLKIMPLPGTTICKYTSFHYINELNFYSNIVRKLNAIDNSFSSFFPKFYYGEMIFNGEGDEAVIILEDLKSRGFKMNEKRSFLDLDQLKLMMRKLGQFHSFSYIAKNTSPEVFYPLVNNIFETNFVLNWEILDVLKFAGERGLKHLQKRDPKYDKYVPKIEAMLQKADDIVIRALTGDKTNPLSVLCHGDYLSTNVMFRYENNVPVDLVFVDLATYRFASPIFDVLGVLYMNCDQQTRNAYWDVLIEEYYTALKKTFPENEVPQKSALLSSELSDQAFYWYLTASHYLLRLIACDNNMSLTSGLDPDASTKIRELNSPEISNEVLIKGLKVMGGEIGTQALGDILVDLIDRGFIC